MNAAGAAAGAAGAVPRRASRLQTIVVLAVTAVVIGIVAVAVGGLGSADPGITMTGGTAPLVGGKLPAFTAVTSDGKPFNLADYAGKPLWVTFGASWCPDCRSEAPDVQAEYAKYKAQGLNLVAIFEEPAADINAYKAKIGLTFPIVVDDKGELRSRFLALGLPTHYFIAADGTIKVVKIGSLHVDEIDSSIAAILN